jgi:hypothetical protein
MTTAHRPPGDGGPAAERPSAAPDATGARAATGRRALLGGLPMVITLASRPALANVNQCTISNVLSGNLSHPLPAGPSCGLTPACWQGSKTGTLWTRTGYSRLDNFTSDLGAIPFGSKWSIVGGQSLGTALSGGLNIQVQTSHGSSTLDATQFGAQVVASLLNAAAFAPNNYPLSTAQVKSVVQAIWNGTPSDQETAQGYLTAVANQLQTYNTSPC